MPGIENTVAVLDDVKSITIKVITLAKDGIGIDDALALATDGDFRQAVEDAVARAKNLPAEDEDLDLNEIEALAPHVTGLVIGIIRALRTPKA